MSNPNAVPPENTKWKPGQSGNPAGKPKGAIHISTHIQKMLNDPNFELKLKDGSLYKGAPIEAIIKTAIAKAMSGDMRAFEQLAKHGYGNTINLNFNDPLQDILTKFGISEGDDAEQAEDPQS
jgi:hypothetical protein